MLKFAQFDILSAERAPAPGRPGATSILRREGHLATFAHVPRRDGFLYVRSRAISSRTNDNFDNFPAEEIKKAYRTFIGKPVFVNHHNADARRARGVVVEAVLHEDRNPDGSPDTWVEVMMEVDAVNFPKLADAILAGDIERTSMGTDVAHSICSVCDNVAYTPSDYCDHVKFHKGTKVRRTDPSTGQAEEVLCYEKCVGLAFFENSLLVEDPADPTAHFLGVEVGQAEAQPHEASRRPAPAQRSAPQRKVARKVARKRPAPARQSRPPLARSAGFGDRLGRCYELSGRYVAFASSDGTQLVHGSIQGGGFPRIGHAWVVLDNGDVLDPVMDEIYTPEHHRAFFSAVEDVRYTPDEVRSLAVEFEHWGPWPESRLGTRRRTASKVAAVDFDALRPEYERRLRAGHPYGWDIPDCGESSAAWFVVLSERGIPVRMKQGSTPDGEDHVWLEVDGQVFDPVPETNPGVAYEDGYDADPWDEGSWPSLAPYRTASREDRDLDESIEELAEILAQPYTSPRPRENPHAGYGGFISMDRGGNLILDGEPVRKLYRVADPAEWRQAQDQGYLQSHDDGYTRASAQADERWRYPRGRSGPRALTLEIDYDPEDRWHASAEGYAATHERIPLHRVRVVGSRTASQRRHAAEVPAIDSDGLSDDAKAVQAALANGPMSIDEILAETGLYIINALEALNEVPGVSLDTYGSPAFGYRKLYSLGSRKTAMPGQPGFVDPASWEMLQAQVRTKVQNAPIPTNDDIERNRRQMQNSSRPGGDFRGNSYDRRRRTQNLLNEFGNGTTAGCAHCGIILDSNTLEADKIISGPLGGRYILPNLLPSCRQCNLARSDSPLSYAASMSKQAWKWKDTGEDVTVADLGAIAVADGMLTEEQVSAIVGAPHAMTRLLDALTTHLRRNYWGKSMDVGQKNNPGWDSEVGRRPTYRNPRTQELLDQMVQEQISGSQRAATAAMSETYSEKGTEGNRTHVTYEEAGTLPIETVRHMGGAMGEVPGEHRNMRGQVWEDFKADLSANGILNPIFITVDPGEEPRLSEGNHRRDAAVELGWSEVPAVVRYFGHSERHHRVSVLRALTAQTIEKEDVATMVDVLAGMLHDSEFANIDDLCQVSVAGTNLFCDQSKNVPRSQMPQLSDGTKDITDDFKQYLRDELGKSVSETTERAANLKATQNQLNGEKVAGMVQAIKAGTMTEEAIMVSSDNYIVDGHHRWAAKVAYDLLDAQLGDVTMPVSQVSMPIMDLIDEANSFAADNGIAQRGLYASRRRGQARKVAYSYEDFDDGCPSCGSDRHLREEWVPREGAYVVECRACEIRAVEGAHYASRRHAELMGNSGGFSGTFWQSGNGKGKLHRSRACKKLNAAGPPLPITVQDVTEVGAVREHGDKLCSTCFPTAPSRKITPERRTIYNTSSRIRPLESYRVQRTAAANLTPAAARRPSRPAPRRATVASREASGTPRGAIGNRRDRQATPRTRRDQMMNHPSNRFFQPTRPEPGSNERSSYLSRISLNQNRQTQSNGYRRVTDWAARQRLGGRGLGSTLAQAAQRFPSVGDSIRRQAVADVFRPGTSRTGRGSLRHMAAVPGTARVAAVSRDGVPAPRVSVEWNHYDEEEEEDRYGPWDEGAYMAEPRAVEPIWAATLEVLPDWDGYTWQLDWRAQWDEDGSDRGRAATAPQALAAAERAYQAAFDHLWSQFDTGSNDAGRVSRPDFPWQHRGSRRRAAGSLRHMAAVPARVAVDETRLPTQIDTLRDEGCPVCGDGAYGGEECAVCGYVAVPEPFTDPDTSVASDLRDDDDPEPRDDGDIEPHPVGVLPADGASSSGGGSLESYRTDGDD